MVRAPAAIVQPPAAVIAGRGWSSLANLQERHLHTSRVQLIHQCLQRYVNRLQDGSELRSWYGLGRDTTETPIVPYIISS